MPLSNRIAPHLAHLRRYSRAITGSQASGDAYVAALLETLISDVSVFPEAGNDRLALFKLYSQVFPGLQITVERKASTFPWEQRAAANLAQVAPRARQAFLLAAVEGFSREEVGEILEVDADGARALLTQAAEDIGRQVATSVMIIEDEPLIAEDLTQLVRSLGHRVTGVARTHDAARELWRADPPGLVLADINLADGSSGVDAVNEALADRAVPVLFITAFPEHLLTGERPEPAFVVTKPFNEDMVKALISQALFFDMAAEVVPG